MSEGGLTRQQRGLALVLAGATILVSLVARDLWYASRRNRAIR